MIAPEGCCSKYWCLHSKASTVCAGPVASGAASGDGEIVAFS